MFYISLSLGNIFLILTLFFFYRKDPIVYSSNLFSTKNLLKVDKYEVFTVLASSMWKIYMDHLR